MAFVHGVPPPLPTPTPSCAARRAYAPATGTARGTAAPARAPRRQRDLPQCESAFLAAAAAAASCRPDTDSAPTATRSSRALPRRLRQRRDARAAFPARRAPRMQWGTTADSSAPSAVPSSPSSFSSAASAGGGFGQSNDNAEQVEVSVYERGKTRTTSDNAGNNGDWDEAETPHAPASKTILVRKGANLRRELLDNNVDVYTLRGKMTNCGGGGQCGTCVVNLRDGAFGNVNPRGNRELRLLEEKGLPETWRLSCCVKVEGAIGVETKPQA